MKKYFLFSLFVMVIGIFSSAKLLSKTKKQKIVEITTSEGVILVKLYNETPLHRDNFLKLAKEGFYEGLLFHRVINEFMLQTGDPGSRNAKQGDLLGYGNVEYTIPPEFDTAFIHKKGALAAARTGDHANPEKRSSGSQFYIVHGRKITKQVLNPLYLRNDIVYTPEQRETYTSLGGTPHLDGQYTIFGEVVSGFEIIDKIAVVETNDSDRPLKDIKIIKVKEIK